LSWAGRTSNSFNRASCSKGALGLSLIVAQRFFKAFQTTAFIVGSLVEGAQRVFDALYGAWWDCRH
jgi:hypothetical protein